jgi:hypothetical protein
MHHLFCLIIALSLCLSVCAPTTNRQVTFEGSKAGTLLSCVSVHEEKLGYTDPYGGTGTYVGTAVRTSAYS